MQTSTPRAGVSYRKSVHPQKVALPLKPAPELKHEFIELEGGRVLLEKDVPIPMRDGIKLYADVYRPLSTLVPKTPTLVFFAPFGKHGAVPREKFQNMDVDFTKLSRYALWELPDPIPWCGEWDYSFVNVDPRGTWWSEGSEANYFSPEEGRDGYDVVEWIAKQEWSTGSVGWGAVSYFAMSAYQTAALQPPHLKAILIWEGISDIYREVNCVGGIPSVAFQHMWMDMTGNGLGQSEDHAVAAIEHPLYDEWWQSKVVDWALINVPGFFVTGWSSLGLHLRGTIEAWKAVSSTRKYLMIHGGREWSEYYKPKNIEKQRLFWNRFLKADANEVDSWPHVQIDIRTSATISVTKQFRTFPPHSSVTSLYLADNHSLTHDASAFSNQQSYQSLTAHDPQSAATYDLRIETPTEITGHSCLKLHLQALHFPDVDLFIALQKLDAQGQEVKFFHSTQQIEASAAFGWLRASHRQLDPEHSTPNRPYHSHQQRQWLKPCDIVEVQIELWPSSTVWSPGETLRVAVKGNPFTARNNVTQARLPSHSFGEVRVWCGQGFDSQLLVPIRTD